MKEKVSLEVSFLSLIKVAALILGLYLIYVLKDIIILLIFVILLLVLFSPVVENWAKKIGRGLAVTAVLLIFAVAFALIIYLIIPPIVEQTQQLSENLPGYLTNLKGFKSYVPALSGYLSSITSNISSIGGNFISITAGLFGGIITFVTAIVLFVYMLIEERKIKLSLVSIFNPRSKEEATYLINKVSVKLSDWFRGQITVSSIVGVIYLIGLLIIGVPYAFTLAVLSLLLDFIPILGPILAGFFAALLALTVSPIKALIVVILYILVQQLENSFIVPKIMGKAVGLSPVVIIIAVLVGAKLMGFLGIILAVPIAATISVILDEMPTVRKVFSKSEHGV